MQFKNVLFGIIITSMKTLFYDVDDFEYDYFLKNSLNSIEAYYFKIPLNSSVYIDEKYKNAQALSVFVESDLNKEVLSQFENLKFIFLRCSGYSNVDLNYCKSKNIKVFNVPDYGSNSVAEFAFGLILDVSRNITVSNSKLKDGYINKEDLIGIELSSKVLGVIGTGSIGKKVLSIAKGFNMNTVCYDINPKGEYNFVSLNELLEKSDFTVICCNLDDSTRHLISKSAFLKMKKTAILINISRGEVVDTLALYDAIVSKKISKAALDVVECEQALCSYYEKCSKNEITKVNCAKKYLFISKLMKMENIIITPHIAYNTVEAKQKIVDITIENIKSSFDINYGTKNLILI